MEWRSSFVEPGEADIVNRYMLRVQSLPPGPGLLPTAIHVGPQGASQNQKARF